MVCLLFSLQPSSSPSPTLAHSGEGNCPINIYKRQGMSCSGESENQYPQSAQPAWLNASLPASTSLPASLGGGGLVPGAERKLQGKVLPTPFRFHTVNTIT